MRGKLTLVQHRPPLVVALLDRVVRHVCLCRAAEEGTEKGDGRHGPECWRACKCWEGSLASGGEGTAVESGVGECVECADEGWEGRESHEEMEVGFKL